MNRVSGCTCDGRSHDVAKSHEQMYDPEGDRQVLHSHYLGQDCGQHHVRLAIEKSETGLRRVTVSDNNVTALT